MLFKVAYNYNRDKNKICNEKLNKAAKKIWRFNKTKIIAIETQSAHVLNLSVLHQ